MIRTKEVILHLPNFPHNIVVGGMENYAREIRKKFQATNPTSHNFWESYWESERNNLSSGKYYSKYLDAVCRKQKQVLNVFETYYKLTGKVNVSKYIDPSYINKMYPALLVDGFVDWWQV
ncbi:hypothetical protein [Priestia megaterium]|uniref:hypothetical protein n=1 Tax=Priestia megaterium TaxID=1404 RepID=UPI003100FACF